MKSILPSLPRFRRGGSPLAQACAIALLLGAGFTAAQAAYITGVSATTDMGSGFGTDITNTVNGVGLATPGDLNSTHSPTAPNDSWVSSGTLTGTTTFDFGAHYSLSGFSFWNQNGGGPGSAGITGIKDVSISYSLDGVTFDPLPGAPTAFSQVPTSGAGPEQFTFPTLTARYVRFTIASNYGDVGQTGFAEVGFDGISFSGPITTVVALKNQAVPGEPVGTIYTGFGTPSFDGTDVDFLAKIKGPGGSRRAIVRGTPQAVVLRTGDVAPDAGTAVFKSFKDPVFAGGTYAVLAGIKATDGSVTPATDSGIWSSATGSLRLVARESGFVPGAGDAIFKTFLSLALSPTQIINPGVVANGGGGVRGAVFVAKLATAAGGASIVDSTNDIGLWREVENSLPELLLREGQTIDVGSGTPDLRTVKTFTCLKSISGSPGQGRSLGTDGGLNARVAFTDGTQAIVQFSTFGSSLFVITKTGDSITGNVGDPVFKKFGIPAFYDGSNGYTFLASLKTGTGGVTTANDTGIFDFAFGFGSFPDFPVVAEGDTAVGAGANYFYKFKDPTTSSDNTAFVASLKKSATNGVTALNDYGLWKGFTGNPFIPLTLVAREGDEGPGVTGSAIKGISSQALADNTGGPLFTAKLVLGTGGVTPADAFALWANLGHTTSTTFLLAQQGHPISASGATYGVRTITVLKGVSGSPGQARAYNDSLGVTYKAKLDGGLEGLFKVQLPTPDEGGGASLGATPGGKGKARH